MQWDKLAAFSARAGCVILKLHEDLKKTAAEKRESYFFGSLVSSVEGSGAVTEYQIIDGQHLKIEEGIYIEKNTSTSMKLSILRRLFELYGADPTDLVFYLKDPEHKQSPGNRT